MIDSALSAAAWLRAPETVAVMGAVTADRRPARFVGGCVRDTLLDASADPQDLDLATPEPPDRVMALLRHAGIAVVPTGLKHGTVTGFAGGRSFEITTLRRDVRTFGRHAEVAFTDDFVADAARRDFTINALSCDQEGRIFDPFDGRRDLAVGRVRFVGEAARRIEEDHLRILRFFRFYARFGRPPPDATALAACAAHAELIDRLSGERVRAELFRLLAAAGAKDSLELMLQTGVLLRILPWQADISALTRLVAVETCADPVLRLAALARGTVPDCLSAKRLAARLRLANAEMERLSALLFEPLPDPTAHASAHRRAVYRLGVARFTDLLRLAVAAGLTDPEGIAEPLRLAAEWQPPSFPIGGDDLIARGVAPGPELGRLLEATRQAWEDADFPPDRETCLRHLEELLAMYRRDA